MLTFLTLTSSVLYVAAVLPLKRSAAHDGADSLYIERWDRTVSCTVLDDRASGVAGDEEAGAFQRAASGRT